MPIFAGLKKFLKKHAAEENLAVIDPKLGNIIKEKLDIPCIYSNAILELSRGVRQQLQGLIRWEPAGRLLCTCIRHYLHADGLLRRPQRGWMFLGCWQEACVGTVTANRQM